MNVNQYDPLCEALYHYAIDLQRSKRPGYTQGDADVLKNFKNVAAGIPVAEVTPEVVWVVYARKHWDAIVSILTRPDLPVSEAAEGRFADLLNYLMLGWALLQEREMKNASTPQGAGEAIPNEGLPLDVVRS